MSLIYNAIFQTFGISALMMGMVSQAEPISFPICILWEHIFGQNCGTSHELLKSPALDCMGPVKAIGFLVAQHRGSL